MNIENAKGPKAEQESKVFASFLQTQDWALRSDTWYYRDGLPIDFVARDGAIGVELSEWLDPNAAKWVNERDRLRDQIESEIASRNLVQFQPGGRTWRCTVQVHVADLPTRGERKNSVIDELITFMVEFERTNKPAIYQGQAIATVFASHLPRALSPFFAEIIFYGFPPPNLGVTLTKALTVDGVHGGETDSALRSLRQTFEAKIISKSEMYAEEKRSLGLAELWLVVHYSSPGVFNAPMNELGLSVGYGSFRRETQDRVASVAETLLQEIGGGPFDRVFLMIDCQPDPYVLEVWKTPQAR
jgi:hypothetical protein